MEDRYFSRDNHSDIHKMICSTPFFQGLPPDAADKATSHIVGRNHPANQVILLENDWGSSVILFWTVGLKFVPIIWMVKK